MLNCVRINIRVQGSLKTNRVQGTMGLTLSVIANKFIHKHEEHYTNRTM
jgi:cytochrome c-type biogenesis protein CcmE